MEEEEEELLDTAAGVDEDPWAPLAEAAVASLDEPRAPEEEGFASLPPPPPPRELPPPTLLLDFEAPLAAPFFSLSLLKNLNLSNIEFLLLEEEEEVEGLDDELLEEEVEEVEPALVLLDCLSPPEPGRPRPTGVGIPETGAALGEVARA